MSRTLILSRLSSAKLFCDSNSLLHSLQLHSRHYRLTPALHRIVLPTFPDFSPKLIPELKVQDSLEACGDHPSLRTDLDAPSFEMEDPYVEPPPKCVICENRIPIDYKNVRLLSQFVSQFTGRILPRKTVGLCSVKYDEVVDAILYARKMALMCRRYKDQSFYDDAALLFPTAERVIQNRIKDFALETNEKRAPRRLGCGASDEGVPVSSLESGAVEGAVASPLISSVG